MTLGHVYDLDLKKNESLIKDVIIQAQGEVRHVLAIRAVDLLATRWHSKNTSSRSRKSGPTIHLTSSTTRTNVGSLGAYYVLKILPCSTDPPIEAGMTFSPSAVKT